MGDQMMATVTALQDEVEQRNRRIFSFVNKMLKEKPLDLSPYFPAMSILKRYLIVNVDYH